MVKRPSAAEAMGDIAPPPAPPKSAPAKKKSAANYARYGKPATYRLPPRLIEQLRRIAAEERVKISDLVTFALQHFVNQYTAGQIDLPKSEPTRYDLTLD